jgi:hypothetical protein
MKLKPKLPQHVDFVIVSTGSKYFESNSVLILVFFRILLVLT